MGTPEFAVESLRRLVENHYNVVAVVTMPDKPVGRHHDTLQASPVKQYAVEQGIPVLQPERLKDERFLEELRSYHADLQVVVAFRMLPEVVWAMPRLGTFNLHAALLPQYRGAAPINWAVINGEKQTGVTTFFLDHEIDTGRVIHREPVPIADTDTVGDVYDRLMQVGADLVLRTVDDVEAGRVEAIPQEQLMRELGITSEADLRPAPKIFKDTCRIQWNQHTVRSAYNFIRGLSPYPAAWTVLRTADGRETPLKIYMSAPSSSEENASSSSQEPLKPCQSRCVTPEGEPQVALLTDGRTYLRVALSDGCLDLTDLQLAGKRRMPVADFLRGARLEGASLI